MPHDTSGVTTLDPSRDASLADEFQKVSGCQEGDDLLLAPLEALLSEAPAQSPATPWDGLYNTSSAFSDDESEMDVEVLQESQK